MEQLQQSSPNAPDPRVSSTRHLPNSTQRCEKEVKDNLDARKLQKADREKLRRDRLNDQFVELGNALDPDRPKNDKATILGDTIQLLKDLTSQVDKLKAEYTTLTEESRELTREKNELREEKASLKSDVESLNMQYQQRLRSMYPWTAMDHSVVMAPPSYPYPMPMPMPPGPIPMHPSMQPYTFFGNQSPAVIHNPCSTYVPFMAPNTQIDQSAQPLTLPMQAIGQSHVSGRHELERKSSAESNIDKAKDSNDVTTELELKTPGSTSDQDLSKGERKSRKSTSSKSKAADGSPSSRCSSSCSVQHSSLNSMVGSSKADGSKQ